MQFSLEDRQWACITRAVEAVLFRGAMDANWEETKHPRAKNGQFGKGSSGGKAKSAKPAAEKKAKASKAESKAPAAKAEPKKKAVERAPHPVTGKPTIINHQGQTPKSFWTYQSSSETPSLTEAVSAGAIKKGTTEKEWDTLSPGMKREILRSAQRKDSASAPASPAKESKPKTAEEARARQDAELKARGVKGLELSPQEARKEFDAAWAKAHGEQPDAGTGQKSEAAKKQPLNMAGKTRQSRAAASKAEPSAQELWDANPQMHKVLGMVKSAVEEKDADGLRQILHLDNTKSRAMFEAMTGAKLPKTVSGTKKAIDDWAKVSPEERTRRDAEHAESRQNELDKVRLGGLEKKLSGVKVKGAGTVKDWVDNNIAQGFNRVIKVQNGKQWGLVNAEGKGFNLSAMKGHAPDIREYAQLVTKSKKAA